MLLRQVHFPQMKMLPNEGSQAMPIEEKMTLNERRKYLKLMKPRYELAGRAEQTHLLTEMERVTGMHRKSLTRLLHGSSLERKKRSTPRSKKYGREVEEIIICVWESLDYVCAERLTPVLAETAAHLERFGVLHLSNELHEQLATISRATVERLLKKHRTDRLRLPQKGPQRANQVSKNVPMGRMAWDLKEPGHFEVDLVHHCGSRTAGEYLHTLQMVDIATGWSERVVIFGRGQQAMEAGFRLILSRLPFAVLELHPDNGSEFFNHHVVRFWGEEITGLRLSRSRPSQKNDNRMGEQKNDSLVRQYFGDLRLDRPEQVQVVNALYEQMWCYYNLFQPVLHLCEKTVIGGKLRRRWDQAQTPYTRLKATGILTPPLQEPLEQRYLSTHPYLLHKRIHQQLARLWDQAREDCLQAAQGEEELKPAAAGLSSSSPSSVA